MRPYCRKARIILPPCLKNLTHSQFVTAIDEANLGIFDTKVATLYFIHKVPQIDIAEEMGVSEITIHTHIKAIRAQLEHISESLFA